PARGVAATCFARARCVLALARAPPLLEAARAASLVARLVIAAVARAVIPAVLPAIRISPAALPAVSCAGLPAIVALRLAAARVAGCLAVPPRLRARGPWGGRGGAKIALAAVIAVMAPPCVGAKAHAHHQHRRKQHARCPHEWPPRWSCNAHMNARGRPSVRPTGAGAEDRHAGGTRGLDGYSAGQFFRPHLNYGLA